MARLDTLWRLKPLDHEQKNAQSDAFEGRIEKGKSDDKTDRRGMCPQRKAKQPKQRISDLS